MKWVIRVGGLGIAGAVLSLAAIAFAASGNDARPATSAKIAIHYSKFGTRELTVAAGEPVAITIDNQDPIAHEWIVGDAATHARHRTGTEPYHDQVPTEVTIEAFTAKTTVVVFDKPGDYLFICHLPGHEEYGMRGTLHVR